MKLHQNFSSAHPFKSNDDVTLSPPNAETWYQQDDLNQAKAMLESMSLPEKLGQLNQVNGAGGTVTEALASQIRAGQVGSVINEVCPQTVAQLQAIAINESPHGIPLLIGRDVIHGFHTIFPLPIGMASTWDPKLVEQTARYSAIEASQAGINWTFSPMIDVCRDARWGRIAECYGEDPLLNAHMAEAMVRGYQSNSLAQDTAIAACAKHFVGYGASESGRDYNTTNIALHDFRNVYFPPFNQAVNAGVATVMTSFSDVNGVAVSANRFLLSDVLREEWEFQGAVVSDWGSVEQLVVHGLADDREHAAYLALNAGVDMEMVSATFVENGEKLLAEQHILQAQIDVAVLRILTLKHALGLFRDAHKIQSKRAGIEPETEEKITALAKEAAIKSCVLLQNKQHCLPLSTNEGQKIALLGFLADDNYEMLGTWVFDADLSRSVTLKRALEDKLRHTGASITYAPAFVDSRSDDTHLFEDALNVAASSDIIIACVGEESILSGEAHCKVDTSLPGAQLTFLRQLSALNKPVICIVMAGRPLLLEDVLPNVDAMLYAWHPGSLGGPAITELLFGDANPSGRLPVSFLRKQGQVPNYYNHKHTGRPVGHDNYVYMSEFPARAEQTSLGMASSHIDCHFTPLFPFGFGLSYTDVLFGSVELSDTTMTTEQSLRATIELTNRGPFDSVETVQLYIRDLKASLTRPVKELKQYKRVEVKANAKTTVWFDICLDDLAFYTDDGRKIVEEGEFDLWIARHSQCTDSKRFKFSKA